MSGKAARKATGKPFAKNDPRINRTKPGPGRPPNWLRDFCDDLLAGPKSKHSVSKILGDDEHPAFATMWKAVADRAHGRAVESIELTGAGGGPVEVQVRFVRE